MPVRGLEAAIDTGNCARRDAAYSGGKSSGDDCRVTPEADQAPSPGWRLPRLGRVARGVLAIVIVLLVALLAVWSQRKTIATDYIDDILRRDRVQARYQIEDLALGRQRLTGVVIGDPAHPDLVADWIELYTDIGFGGVRATTIRAGHVRLRARLIGGHVSLGAIDRLLPPPSGKPFTLPAIRADVQDLRIRFVAPQGVVGLKVSGRGKLDDGFSGSLAAVSDRVKLPGCAIGRVEGVFAIHITDAQPHLQGPLRVAQAHCGQAALAGFASDVDATLGDQLDRWQGKATVMLAQAQMPQARFAGVNGTIGFTGSASATHGTLDLDAGRFVAPDAAEGGLGLSGHYALAKGAPRFTGRVTAHDARIAARYLAPLDAASRSAQGTPVGPLASAFAQAARGAAARFDLDADVAADLTGGKGSLSVSRMMLNAASGARATVSGGQGIAYDWPGGAMRIDGALALSGGGLPEMTVQLRQAGSGGPSGQAVIAPYEAGGARLALEPLRFHTTPRGAHVFTTVMTLSGPLGDGRVDTLSLPLAGAWNARGDVLLNPACTPLSFNALSMSGLALDHARLQLCPNGSALLRVANGRVSGGARFAAPRLAGRLGGTPITIAASGATVALGDKGFAAQGLAVRLGQPERVTRLDFVELDGRFTKGAIAGTFKNGGGQIGNVPLLLSDATADWSLHDARLAVAGTMTVSDAAASARFKPLAARAVTLTLAGNRIDAKAALFPPGKDAKVADVTLTHDLASGAGRADLTVPGITFAKGFQPDDLTSLTYGVIADVKGTIAGAGHIAWDAKGVISNGDFHTDGTDLAAAFGPVTGLSGSVHFTDLLALESAPHQLVKLATVNPGIAVNDGEIRFQTLPNTRVRIEQGVWPFAGGTLTLQPTLLDFGAPAERHLTFAVRGIDARQFLQQFDFKNLDATGIFDGELPMIFDTSGGRIENGRLVVRPGGGTLAYVGEISQKDLGFWGNMAFQALKSLKYRSLDLTMNGPLAGEVITEVHFEGLAQGTGAKRNFVLDRLQKLPFVFNVRIRAPFRSLIDSAASLYDPKRLIERNLPALIEEQNKRAAPPDQPQSIQPQESRTVP